MQTIPKYIQTLYICMYTVHCTVHPNNNPRVKFHLTHHRCTVVAEATDILFFFVQILHFLLLLKKYYFIILNMSTPSITHFFSQSKNQRLIDKNSFVAAKLSENVDKILDVDREKDNESNTASDGVDILHEQIKLLQKELKQAKILLRKANDVNMQKDLQIKALKQQLNKDKVQAKSNVLLFENHAHRFDSKDIKKIRSIKAGQRNDSAFILSITKALYKDEEAKLKERRATSRKYKDSTKSEISAEKKAIMREMLEERLINETNEADEYIEIDGRLKKLNTHMRHALKNSATSNEKKQKHDRKAVSTKQTQPLVSSTPITYSPAPVLQNTDQFHSYNPNPIPFSPIQFGPPFQYTSQQSNAPQYYPYYSHYQPSPMQTDWAQYQQLSQQKQQ